MLNQTEEQTCRLNGRWRGGDEGRVLHGNYSSQLKRLGWVDCCPFSFLSPAVLLWQFHTRAINVDRHISVWTLHRDPNWLNYKQSLLVSAQEQVVGGRKIQLNGHCWYDARWRDVPICEGWTYIHQCTRSHLRPKFFFCNILLGENKNMNIYSIYAGELFNSGLPFLELLDGNNISPTTTNHHHHNNRRNDFYDYSSRFPH